MKNNPPINKEDDTESFSEMVSGVQPLADSNRISHTPPPPKPKVLHFDEVPSGSAYHIGVDDLSTTAGLEESLFFCRGGIQDKQIRKLKQGKLRPEAVLDLHGLTLNQAHQEIMHFFHQTQHNNIRSALIIHGKGYRSEQHPVLKSALASWLPQHPAVLAFCSAQPKDGGNGALYVLLAKIDC